MLSNDLREQPLIDATRRIMSDSNYDPHFAHVGEREIMETKLFLARYDALMAYYRNLQGFKIGRDGDLIAVLDVERRFPRSVPTMPDPIDMILWCPSCAVQHVDATEDHKPECAILARAGKPPCNCDRWTNPPHRSHLCHYCGHVWRPADVPTNGVREILTVGEHDDPAPVRGVIDKLVRFRPRWRHKARQTEYEEIGIAELQTRHANGRDQEWAEGFKLMVYRGSDGKLWARAEKEFDGDRFEPLP